MLNVSQSLLQPDQYRFGIKSPVLLYSSDYSPKTLRLKPILNHDYYYRCTTITIQLETALCYQHCFCNAELRTAIITKIKGLLIQAQQNTFVLFTLFKLTSDECKTLTKVSTRNTSHKHSQKTSAPISICEGTKGKQQAIQRRAACIVRGKTSKMPFASPYLKSLLTVSRTPHHTYKYCNILASCATPLRSLLGKDLCECLLPNLKFFGSSAAFILTD